MINTVSRAKHHGLFDVEKHKEDHNEIKKIVIHINQTYLIENTVKYTATRNTLSSQPSYILKVKIDSQHYLQLILITNEITHNTLTFVKIS